jgi:glutamyl-tRNA synthetase
VEEFPYEPEAAARELTPENKPRLARLREALAALEPFDADNVGKVIPAIAKESGVKTGVLVHPTRLACCGTTAGPSLYHLIAILGKQRTLARLDRALAAIP